MTWRTGFFERFALRMRYAPFMRIVQAAGSSSCLTAA